MGAARSTTIVPQRRRPPRYPGSLLHKRHEMSDGRKEPLTMTAGSTGQWSGKGGRICRDRGAGNDSGMRGFPGPNAAPTAILVRPRVIDVILCGGHGDPPPVLARSFLRPPARTPRMRSSQRHQSTASASAAQASFTSAASKSGCGVPAKGGQVSRPSSEGRTRSGAPRKGLAMRRTQMRLGMPLGKPRAPHKRPVPRSARSRRADSAIRKTIFPSPQRQRKVDCTGGFLYPPSHRRGGRVVEGAPLLRE